MYTFKYLKKDRIADGSGAEFKETETVFEANNDDTARAYASTFIDKQRREYPVNEYKPVALYAVRPVEVW